MKYKHSFYNICSNKPNNHVIYNTLYNSLVRMNDEEYGAYCFNGCCDDKLKDELVKNGLWVNADIDERERFLAISNMLRNVKMHPFTITIATTMKCNACCPYCYESGVQQNNMSSATESKLMEFIKHIDAKDGLDLIWFGGEPLLNIELIDRITEFLSLRGTKYSSYIITNGSLINDELIDKMANLWKVIGTQITLDGVGDEYERRKNYISGKPYFKAILKNINKLCDNGIHVDIRINIDRANSEDCITLTEVLACYFSDVDNISFYPAFLSGSASPFSDEEKINIISKMLGVGADCKKLTINNKLYSTPKIRPCMICDPYNIAIDTEGFIYNCDHNLGHSDRSIGVLNDSIDVLRYENFCLDSACKDCVYLPKCFGGCTSDRLHNDRACLIDRYLIQAYIESL